MLQPRRYPELIGKALFVEPDPFLVMAHDDEPLAEGALLAASIGVVVGVAQVAGNWLQGMLAPAPATLDPFVAQPAPRLNADIAFWMADPVRFMMQGWHDVLALDSGWWQTLLFLVAPVLLLLVWLVSGTLLWAVGRALGGEGTFTQVLGACALVMAPALLFALHIVPFTFVNALLPLTWALVLYYRAAQMSHDLVWARALGATALSALLLVLGWLLLGAGTFLLATAL